MTIVRKKKSLKNKPHKKIKINQLKLNKTNNKNKRNNLKANKKNNNFQRL